MTSFIIQTPDFEAIRFAYYIESAPLTSAAFEKTIPFSKKFFHAKISGQEIWIDDAPELDIIQENCSVFPEPGEIIIGPINPSRNKISKCIGIFYGEGRLLDCGNIFGKVFPEDMSLLKSLGDRIWRQGAQQLSFEKMR